jgi:hypothetical protein
LSQPGEIGEIPGAQRNKLIDCAAGKIFSARYEALDQAIRPFRNEKPARTEG